MKNLTDRDLALLIHPPDVDSRAWWRGTVQRRHEPRFRVFEQSETDDGFLSFSCVHRRDGEEVAAQ